MFTSIFALFGLSRLSPIIAALISLIAPLLEVTLKLAVSLTQGFFAGLEVMFRNLNTFLVLGVAVGATFWYATDYERRHAKASAAAPYINTIRALRKDIAILEGVIDKSVPERKRPTKYGNGHYFGAASPKTIFRVGVGS